MDKSRKTCRRYRSVICEPTPFLFIFCFANFMYFWPNVLETVFILLVMLGIYFERACRESSTGTPCDTCFNANQGPFHIVNASIVHSWNMNLKCSPKIYRCTVDTVGKPTKFMPLSCDSPVCLATFDRLANWKITFIFFLSQCTLYNVWSCVYPYEMNLHLHFYRFIRDVIVDLLWFNPGIRKGYLFPRVAKNNLQCLQSIRAVSCYRKTFSEVGIPKSGSI